MMRSLTAGSNLRWMLAMVTPTIFSSGIVKAQTDTRLTGTVTDRSAASVVGAGIEARNLETGVAHRTLSGASPQFIGERHLFLGEFGTVVL